MYSQHVREDMEGSHLKRIMALGEAVKEEAQVLLSEVLVPYS